MKQRIFIWYEIVSLFLIGFNGILHLKRILCREQQITISNNNNTYTSSIYIETHLNKIDFYWIYFQPYIDKRIKFVSVCYISLRFVWWTGGRRRRGWEWMKNWPQAYSYTRIRTITSLLVYIKRLCRRGISHFIILIKSNSKHECKWKHTGPKIVSNWGGKHKRILCDFDGLCGIKWKIHSLLSLKLQSTN